MGRDGGLLMVAPKGMEMDALFGAIELYASLAFVVRPCRDLAMEGIRLLRQALDYSEAAPRFVGVVYGDGAGLLLATLLAHGTAMVQAVKHERKRLRQLAEGLALLDESLRWQDEIVARHEPDATEHARLWALQCEAEALMADGLKGQRR